MRTDQVRSLLLAGALLAAAGCASSEEWRTWKEHPTHFASGDHMSFSVRTPESGPAQIKRKELVAARDEAWWGKAVMVDQAQILER